MSYVLTQLYEGLLFRPERKSYNPLISLFVVILEFVAIFLVNNEFLIVLFLLVLLEALLLNFHGIKSISVAISGLVIFLGGLTFIFAGPLRAYQVSLRLIIGGIIFSTFFIITNPSDLARGLEKLRFPTKIALFPALILAITPTIAKDAIETVETLKLRGEIKGFFIRWLPKVIVIFIASMLYRATFLAQALYFRGFGLGKRTHYKTLPTSARDLIRVILWIASFALIIVAMQLQWMPKFITF